MKGTYQKNKALVIALTALAWSSVLLQLFITLHSNLQNGKGISGGIVSFVGYFTILTNLLVCAALTLPLMAPASAAARFCSRSDVTAGVATSIILSLDYFLLRNTWNPQGLQLLADVLLHYAIPALYLIYWWFNFPLRSGDRTCPGTVALDGARQRRVVSPPLHCACSSAG
jgi:hypothetical protein